MRSKLVIPILMVGISVAATALPGPASAQYYGRVYGPAYYGPGIYGPVYGPSVYPRAYYYPDPVIGPLSYGDGWVPESIYQHSRTGGIDPNIRPFD